ncbi:MAG: amidohydrolase family protein [Planctomycetaceae bacterium]|nr:amidohydrolase family protein [Planctomycetaceae bacterium]
MNVETRREFLVTTSATLGALAAATLPLPAAEDNSPRAPRDAGDGIGLPRGWRTFRKYDAHNHVMQAVHQQEADWSPVENLIEAADFLGIDKLFCSRPLTGGVLAEIDAVRDANNSILAAMRRFPGRIEGYCFVQPGNGAAALDEIDRCLDAGMMGVKLYNQFKYNNPVIFPIAERCVERRIPFLGHSAFLTDPATLAVQPRTSNALEFGELSTRYPELMLILGHVNGGGDWEWAIKALRDFPNVFVDTSGSVQEDDAVGLCVRELGHHRVLFATDLTMEGGVGKILSAELTSEQREDVFWRNFQRILDRRVT